MAARSGDAKVLQLSSSPLKKPSNQSLHPPSSNTIRPISQDQVVPNSSGHLNTMLPHNQYQVPPVRQSASPPAQMLT